MLSGPRGGTTPGILTLHGLQLVIGILSHSHMTVPHREVSPGLDLNANIVYNGHSTVAADRESSPAPLCLRTPLLSLHQTVPLPKRPPHNSRFLSFFNGASFPKANRYARTLHAHVVMSVVTMVSVSDSSGHSSPAPVPQAHRDVRPLLSLSCSFFCSTWNVATPRS